MPAADEYRPGAGGGAGRESGKTTRQSPSKKSDGNWLNVARLVSTPIDGKNIGQAKNTVKMAKMG